MTTEQEWLEQVAAKVRRQAKKHGIVTIVLDSEGTIQTIPGHGEVIGTYRSDISLNEIQADLGFDER